MRREEGFTLLEAIVALVILAAAGMALFLALNSSLKSIERVGAAATLDSATMNALARMESVNPMKQREGVEQLGDVRMRWSSTEIEASRPTLNDYMQLGLFDVALFKVQVELMLPDGSVRRFALEKVGWEQARFPEGL